MLPSTLTNIDADKRMCGDCPVCSAMTSLSISSVACCMRFLSLFLFVSDARLVITHSPLLHSEWIVSVIPFFPITLISVLITFDESADSVFLLFIVVLLFVFLLYNSVFYFPEVFEVSVFPI